MSSLRLASAAFEATTATTSARAPTPTTRPAQRSSRRSWSSRREHDRRVLEGDGRPDPEQQPRHQQVVLEAQVVRPDVDAHDERPPARDPEGRPVDDEQAQPDEPEDREHDRRAIAGERPQVPERRRERRQALGREQAAVLAAELLARHEEPEPLERDRVVVGQGRVRGRRDRDVRVGGDADEGRGHRREEPRGAVEQLASAGPQRVGDEERGDERREQVVADAEADEQAADREVAQPPRVRPDQRAVHERAVSARWSGFTSATTADDQTVAIAPVARAVAAASHQRTPSRCAIAVSVARATATQTADRRLARHATDPIGSSSNSQAVRM